MYQSVNQFDFVHAFTQCGRKDQFSHETLKALFSYLENLEEDLGEPIELDPIAICCEYTEYVDAVEAYSGYKNDPTISEEDALEYLYENTVVIETECGIVIQDF